MVIDQGGQAHTLHPRDITYEVAGSDWQSSDISTFLQDVDNYIDPSHLEIAWELLHEAGESTDPASLALLLFSDQSPPSSYAAHRLLSDDKLFFKQKGNRYEPRSQAQVEERLHQIHQETKRQQEWNDFLQRARQCLGAEAVVWHKSDRPRLDALERFALFGEEAHQRSAAVEILQALNQDTTPAGAFELLVSLGVWSPHENLPLRRSQMPTQFSEEILTMATRRLSNVPPDPDGPRLDLTHLKVYTIDDENTSEIDDGLSLESLADGRQRLWIHIADPTRWLEPGDALDLEARRRCTTLYLPTGMIPMFPAELATGPMSLLQGQVCCALSFAVLLNQAGGLVDYSIHPTLIKPTYRLTYEDADEMLDLALQDEPELAAIAQWAKQRQAWRLAQGAIAIQMPESAIRVSETEDEITIDVLDDSPARQMVAEMMILAGEVAACYGETHALPIPFRSQPQPELPSDEELLQLPSGWVRDCAIRRCMPRSEVSLVPNRHATLGLDHYSQVTSPIRRYTDLLAHFQIKAHLRGDSPPFSPAELTELTQGAMTAAYEATMVERQTKRYWALEYLRRRQDQIWSAMLLRWLRQHEGLGLIMLEELGLELPLRVDRTLELGEHLKVRVARANPRQDVVQLEEATEVAAPPVV
nr:ribonuclease R family protein [Halomicronema hongdechloris]